MLKNVESGKIVGGSVALSDDALFWVEGGWGTHTKHLDILGRAYGADADAGQETWDTSLLIVLTPRASAASSAACRQVCDNSFLPLIIPPYEES